VTLIATAVRMSARIAANRAVTRSGMADGPHRRELTFAQARRCLGWLAGAALMGLLGAGVAGAVPPVQDTPSIESRLDLLFGSHEPYRKFLADLQRAVAAGDRDQVADMVRYPLRTHIAGRAVSLANPRHFLAHFDELLPQKSLDAITAQTFAGLFANSQGVMIGSGEVWFSAVCRARDCNAPPVMIIALNPQAPLSP
jgi:hypothetical protein